MSPCCEVLVRNGLPQITSHEPTYEDESTVNGAANPLLGHFVNTWHASRSSYGSGSPSFVSLSPESENALAVCVGAALWRSRQKSA